MLIVVMKPKYKKIKTLIKSRKRKSRCVLKVLIVLVHKICFQIILSPNNLKLLPSGLALVCSQKNSPITRNQMACYKILLTTFFYGDQRGIDRLNSQIFMILYLMFSS